MADKSRDGKVIGVTPDRRLPSRCWRLVRTMRREKLRIATVNLHIAGVRRWRVGRAGQDQLHCYRQRRTGLSMARMRWTRS